MPRGRKRKPFIDKKTAVKFSVAPRTEHDIRGAGAGGNKGSNYVLIPLNDKAADMDVSKPSITSGHIVCIQLLTLSMLSVALCCLVSPRSWAWQWTKALRRRMRVLAFPLA